MTDARDATTIDDVRALASRLPRSYEALVRDRVKGCKFVSTLSAAEMRELVLEAWRMVVPKGVAEDFDLGVPDE